MWDQNDQQNYNFHLHHRIGQISNDSFSREIEKYASNPLYKSFLEVGTWNGLGSTKAFFCGLKSREDDYVFYSLECNKHKHEFAKNLYKFCPKMHLLNEVIWNQQPLDFYDIFPQCRDHSLYAHWHEVDMINMQQCQLFLNREEIPEIFDVVLLDGGEFTTYHEFQLLKNRCKILMLDDINVDKCKLIVREIYADRKWKIIKTDTVRNGYLIAERI